MSKFPIKKVDVNGIPFYVREGTTDENCLKEVVKDRCYRHTRFKFDVDEGEHWLDLGGNVGTFALYCKIRGATCDSYEPEPACFAIMEHNMKKWKGFKAFETAITNKRESQLQFYFGSKETDKYRNTIIKNRRAFLVEFPNAYASEVLEKEYDGIKLDIEGSEFGLIDDKLIPKCNKLVMEYHITKDKSMSTFHRRMDVLRSLFEDVYYMPSLDKFPKDSEYPGFFDRFVYCKNWKE